MQLSQSTEYYLCILKHADPIIAEQEHLPFKMFYFPQSHGIQWFDQRMRRSGLSKGKSFKFP